MLNSNTQAEIAFRFLSLNKLQAFTLQREILDSSYKKQLEHDSYVGYVPLSELNFEDINNFYVRQRIDFDQCDIFISITCDLPANTVEVPVIVNRFLRYIDCRLTFSYTTG